MVFLPRPDTTQGDRAWMRGMSRNSRFCVWGAARTPSKDKMFRSSGRGSRRDGSYVWTSSSLQHDARTCLLVDGVVNDPNVPGNEHQEDAQEV